MAEIKRMIVPAGIYPTAADVYCRIEMDNPGQADDGYLLDNSDGNFVAAPADSYITVTEVGSTTRYVLDESRQIWPDRKYSVTFFKKVGGSRDHTVDLSKAYGEMIIKDDLEVYLDDVPDLVWDEPLTGATHNIPTSAGRRLRAQGDVVSGSVDDVSATATTFITDLTGIQPDHYADQTLLFTSGNLAGMSRQILNYNESTKLVTIEEALPEAPANGDDFDINPVHIHPVSQVVQEVWDRVLSSANHNINKSAGKILRELKEIAGYEGGFIYYDSVGGADGDEKFINGTLENPVKNETDLLTLKAALKIDQVKIRPGSTLTLTAAHEKQEYTGEAWTLNLGGQSISASFFHGATSVNGIGTGVIPPKFEDCTIENVTMPPSSYHKCRYAGIFTIGSAGDFFFVSDSHSGVAGIGTPFVDYNSIGNVNLNYRGYHGGTEVENMQATDNLSFDGDGQLIINANCNNGGTMRIAGHQKITGAAAFIAAGGVIEDDARFALDQLVTHVIGADSDTLKTLSDQIDTLPTDKLSVVAGGGTSTPAYAVESESSLLVQGDVVGIARYLEGDHSAKRLFFGAKIATGDASYIIGVIEATNITYSASTDLTSYTIPFVANDTKTVDPGIYKGETEIRDADGVSNPITGDRYDFEVPGEIIT